MVLSFRLVVWTPAGALSSLRRYLDPQEVDDCHRRIAVRTSSPETYPRHETPAILAIRRATILSAVSRSSSGSPSHRCARGAGLSNKLRVSCMRSLLRRFGPILVTGRREVAD